MTARWLVAAALALAPVQVERTGFAAHDLMVC